MSGREDKCDLVVISSSIYRCIEIYRVWGLKRYMFGPKLENIFGTYDFFPAHNMQVFVYLCFYCTRSYAALRAADLVNKNVTYLLTYTGSQLTRGGGAWQE